MGGTGKLRAEIISIGTELLLGQIVDTDAAHLSRLLADLGIDLYYRSTVGDNFARVVEAVVLALSRSDIVFTIGGLGPTEDDLTKEAVAEAMGVELVLDEPSAESIRRFFSTRGIPFVQRNLKQALIPKEGCALPNENGTAPGVVFEHDGKIVITLPGPPSEFVQMVERGVVPFLTDRFGATGGIIKSRVLKIAGLGESAVEERVQDLLYTTNPTVAPLAGLGEVRLRITAKADNEESASTMISEVENKLRERLGTLVFGVDDETLEQVVVEMLTAQKLRLALAESCTGGLLAHRITNVPGSSDALLAGIVAYSNKAKTDLLGLPKDIIDAHGAVSHEVARAMAEGARKVTGADIGMGITGIAGPGGGTVAKPVGLVYIALSSEDQTSSTENRFVGSRGNVKMRSAQAALTMLRQSLL